ncbi:transcriptional regulator, RpiR family [Plantibacter sp. VKM Ac-1784]|uniref:Transcriptional regulator, RpiR family n=1 Tax=Plantibacter elymi (nom. nud.) TaxID=199708 RepID=A0ABY1RE62_9MICO|nr:MurR/RpiR family transcriptional regulator [Plantibacter sp. VKM Ac-1784]SMQ71162.1 transcriptional regulator, RpiR family [Plantibacter sp. VKM Ac-1784]
MSDRTPLIAWLESLAAQATRTETTEKLKDALAQNPSRGSYAAISDVSSLAELNPAAVTRTAQSWGFSGWPELRVALRSRYLESLSFTEVASERRLGTPASPVASSFDADRRALMSTSSTIDLAAVRAVAHIAGAARRRVSIGSGTYKSVSDLLATYFTLAGYPTQSPDETSGMVGALSDLGPGDIIFGVDLWRGYASTIEALAIARETGATVCLITDRGATGLRKVVDHLFHVSSESSTFFPTLVPAVALVNALASELALLDSAVTEASSQRFEHTWRRMGFDQKHRPPSPTERSTP